MIAMRHIITLSRCAARTVQPVLYQNKSNSPFAVAKRSLAFTPKCRSDAIKVHFILENGNKCEVEGDPDETLYDLVVNSDMDIEGFGACGGVGQCSTCHLILEPSVYEKLDLPQSSEQDILDRIPMVTENSRLGCQINLTSQLHNAHIIIPSLRKDLREE